MEKPPGSAIDVAAFEEMGPRGRRSNSVEKPPSSAIANPKSPVGHPRRSSVNNPPPKSDIKVSAFDDIIPRRRSAAQDNEPVPVQPEETVDESKQVKENVGDLKLASGEKDVEQEQSPETGEFAFSVQRVYTEENEFEFDDRNEEPQLFLRMLLNTERSTCRSFHNVRVGDVLVRVGDAYVSELGLEGSGSVLTKFFAKLTAQTPIKLTFQRMYFSEWEGGVEL
ncbi:hypothetical protein BBJ29_007555 [Phytophthora kernoviae]|uniref:Uncharacterized protein n=1 Tax=Phytophthora kernoviae TaxID=325452 RepID=A0A3F2REG9_9STRA|nr:hypothetical protein BBJ29_007555 [Phytophthora kernoviae]RLN54774.1 hypothetical protein BBP00_00008787 [Phytophthora kernoviae]